MTKRKNNGRLNVIPGGKNVPPGTRPPVVDPKKRVKANKEDITALTILRNEMDGITFGIGRNRDLFLEQEKILKKQKEGVKVQVNSLLRSYKEKYKIVGEPINWDPKTCELLLK